MPTSEGICSFRFFCGGIRREHDPEKWIPVFEKDHAQITTKRNGDSI
jgi:hypothetical protein